MFNVNWTTSDNVGVHEVISIKVINSIPDDMAGTILLQRLLLEIALISRVNGLIFEM